MSFARLHTTSANFLLSSLRSSSQTWISTSSTLRQYGAPTEKMTTKEMSAFTLTTGRTIEGNLQSSATLKTCAKIGTQRTSSLPTKMAAPLSIGAHPAMVGKSRNSTQITSSSSSVCTETHARSRIARTFILILIESFLSPAGSSSSQRQERSPSPPISMSQSSGMSVLSTSRLPFRR